MTIYNWQHALWEHLIAQSTHLPHAILLHGKSGIGKLDFAFELSKTLLCHLPKNGHACNFCPKCTWFNEGGHPDFKSITTEESEPAEDSPKKKTSKKTQISVEQIRGLIQALSLTNHETTSLRVVLIQPAEALNQASANALLKVLEEPPNNTIFILVADNLQRLLPTIISRCHKIAMPLPTHAQSLEWLAEKQIKQPDILLNYSSGSPLQAIKNEGEFAVKSQVFSLLARGVQLDANQCVVLMMEGGMELAINTLQKWVQDLLLCRFSLDQHYHIQHGNTLQLLSKSVNLSKLLSYQKTLILAKQTAQHPLSMELQLENLLIHYKKIFMQ